MKNLVELLLSAVIVAAFAIAPAYGTQPDQAKDPNNFHSTEPYVLYIIGSKGTPVCEQQKDTLGNPIYGNDVFVPLNGNNIKILLQSVPGKREGEIPPLQVIDPCTASLDGSPATVQIPKNAHGYKVYVRPLGKLTNIPYLQIAPQLMTANDESGNTLVYLGQLTQTGLETPNVSLSREGGQWTPQDITPLLEWSGKICSPACSGICIKTSSLCCTVSDPILPPPPSSIPGMPGVQTSPAPLTPTLGSCSPKSGLCPVGTVEEPLYCKTYTNEFLLSIPEFAAYLSGSTGQKLEIRFYPVNPEN